MFLLYCFLLKTNIYDANKMTNRCEELLDKFLNTDLKEIRIFSRDEKKQEDMRIKYKNDKLKF